MRVQRDRHGRGLRGPLATTNPYGSTARPPQRPAPEAYFHGEVAASVKRIKQQCPRALAGVVVGIEEVPYLRTDWTGSQVPLAAAVDSDGENPARVVIYRRPLEHRAASRDGLSILIHRIIVEQLSALTGIATDEIDPDGLSEDDY